MVWIILPIFLVMAALWLWYQRESERALIAYAGHRTFTGFASVLALVAICAMAGRFMAFGDFPQPSEVRL